jgi:hypothetical protein
MNLPHLLLLLQLLLLGLAVEDHPAQVTPLHLLTFALDLRAATNRDIFKSGSFYRSPISCENFSDKFACSNFYPKITNN